MRRQVPLVLALAAALAAGCGSTVQQSTSTLAPGDTGLGASPGTTSGDSGLSVPSTTSGGLTAGGTTGTTSGTTATGTTTGTTSTGTTSTSGATTSGGSGSTTLATGPGITDTTIYYGDIYSSQLAAADTAIGASGDAPSYDTRDVENAVVDYANKHGGFAGRQLKVIYYDLKLSNPRPSEDAAACAKWTQDNKVFAMYGATDIYRQCAEKAGAISILSGNSVASTFKKYPHFVDPLSIRLDRLGPVTVGGLYRAHYFTGKLGLITWDDPNYRFAMTNGYLPALASHGIKPATDPVYVSVTQDVNSVAELAAQMRSTVAKFKALGIDHVVIQDGPAGVWAGGGLTLEFMNNAKSQNYYPRYGANAYNIPGSSQLPADEMDHELAIMDSDSKPEYDAGWHQNVQRQQCFKIESDAGLPPKNENDQSLAAQYCDVIFFFQRLVNAVPQITADTVINQVSQLGTSFKTAYIYGTNFFPGRRDGSDKVRQAEYFQSCKCMKYSGPPYQPD
jgi:hypothetical protein